MISMVSKAHIIVKNMHAEVKSRGVAFPLFVGLNENWFSYVYTLKTINTNTCIKS